MIPQTSDERFIDLIERLPLDNQVEAISFLLKGDGYRIYVMMPAIQKWIARNAQLIAVIAGLSAPHKTKSEVLMDTYREYIRLHSKLPSYRDILGDKLDKEFDFVQSRRMRVELTPCDAMPIWWYPQGDLLAFTGKGWTKGRKTPTKRPRSRKKRL
jgi:hypothetical protein